MGEATGEVAPGTKGPAGHLAGGHWGGTGDTSGLKAAEKPGFLSVCARPGKAPVLTVRLKASRCQVRAAQGSSSSGAC